MHDPDLHLFVGESGVSLRQHLYRMVHPARRESLGPVLPANGEDEGTAIGYASAVRDAASGAFRMWYMCHADMELRLAVSEDGRTWERRGPAVVGEGRYGIEDVRQALREASEQGTHCLALAVRDKGEAYLTQMFGTHGWMLLPDVHSLPSHFVSVATDFLKS